MTGQYRNDTMTTGSVTPEGGTAVTIMMLLPLPMGAAFVLLPIIGIALNGTSSVLYGTVPELVAADRRETAFGVFYTATIGAGAVSPVLYGFFGDALDLINNHTDYCHCRSSYAAARMEACSDAEHAHPLVRAEAHSDMAT